MYIYIYVYIPLSIYICRSYISTLWAPRPTCPSGSSTFLAAASSNWSRISSASRSDAFPSAQRTLQSKTPQPSTDRPNLPRYTWLLIGARERLCCLRLTTKANETGHVRCRSLPSVRHLLSMRFSKASTVSFALLWISVHGSGASLSSAQCAASLCFRRPSNNRCLTHGDSGPVRYLLGLVEVQKGPRRSSMPNAQSPKSS